MTNSSSTYRYINQFREVFSCNFLHEFYPNRELNELEIGPTQECNYQLKNLNLIFKESSNGFVLAANSNKDYSSTVFGELIHLDFGFRFTNPYFLSFSKLDINPDTKYFINDEFSEKVDLNGSHVIKNMAIPNSNSGILRVIHNSENPILPGINQNNDYYKPRRKMVFIHSRQVLIVYICYAQKGDLSKFENGIIEVEGELKGLLSFLKPEKTTTVHGYPALKLTASSSIPMKKFWGGFFRFVAKHQLGTYTKIMPNPHPLGIKYNPITQTYISETYVKL